MCEGWWPAAPGGRRGQKNPPLEPLVGARPCRRPDSGAVMLTSASRTGRDDISLVPSILGCRHLLREPREANVRCVLQKKGRV